MEMEYRRLGPFGPQGERACRSGRGSPSAPSSTRAWPSDCLAAASEAGVNFFDNAESYSGGESERIMGKAIARLGWPRHSYVVSTKLFWGIHDEVNMRNTLNRKYLSQAIDGSLERFGLDFVDLVFCHRADPETPIEETVWAMSDMVSSGKALYWGTSEWTADEIRAAWEIAERHHLHKPVMEQPQYNMLERHQGRDRSTPASTTTSASASPSGARWRRGCSPASTSTASPTGAGPRCPATSGSRAC